MSETTEPDIERILISVAQLLDGWHNDGTAWTEWDESVRRDVTRCREAWIRHRAQLTAALQENERLRETNRLKSEYMERARPLCPDHRDKQRGEDCLACQIETLERQLASGAEELKRREATLREEWWHNHGCPSAAKYGDDGEMQCGACRTNFKAPTDDQRAFPGLPFAELEVRVRDLRMVAISKAWAALSGDTPTTQAPGTLGGRLT